MTNNDILRSLRYTFDFHESKIVSLFKLADLTVSQDQISQWLKKDDDPDYQICSDNQLAIFLNGLIIEKRGKKEGPTPEPETRINNNIVFRKLKIALDLKDNDILDIIKLANFSISKHELCAFFRKKGHKNYRECKDQVLRYFLSGLQKKLRNMPTSQAPTKPAFDWSNISPPKKDKP